MPPSVLLFVQGSSANVGYKSGMGDRSSDLPPLPPGYERDNGAAERRRLAAITPHESMLDYARAMGFDESLSASPLVWRRFRGTRHWDHEHCVLCGAKFIDPDLGQSYREWLSKDPELLTEGYANRPESKGDRDDDGDWLCAKCFAQYGAELRLSSARVRSRRTE